MIGAYAALAGDRGQRALMRQRKVPSQGTCTRAPLTDGQKQAVTS